MSSDSDLRHWLDRAEKLRAKAHRALDPRSKRLMLGLANTYERLAAQIDQPKWKRRPTRRQPAFAAAFTVSHRTSAA